MTITLARPTTDEILLDAAAAPVRATMHTSKIAARNLRHNSLFMLAAGGNGQTHRVLGTPVRTMIADMPVVMVTVADPDGLPVVWGYGINEAVYGVVGAI